MSTGAWVTREWSSIRPGDFVRDPAGAPWQVQSRGVLGDITVAGPASGTTANIGKQSGPVTMWDGSPEALALEDFRAALGAKILYDQH